jgi:replicative DNA helicase
MTLRDDVHKVPPSNVAAELALVGGLLVFQAEKEYHAVRDIVSPSDFYSDRTRLVFEAIGELVSTGAQLTFPALEDRLRARKVGLGDGFDFIDGKNFLAQLASEGDGNFAANAKAIFNASIRRQFIEIGTDLRELAETGAAPEDLIASAEQRILEVSRVRSGVGGPQYLRDLMQKAWDEAQQPLPHGILGIPTGSRRLNFLLNGFLPGKLYIMVGRPGVGKSAKAWWHGYCAAASGFRSHMFSLEMDADEIGLRSLANLLSVDSYKILRREVRHNPIVQAQSQFALEAADVPFTFDDQIFEFERILSRARALAREGCRMFVFDYLLLFGSNQKFERDEMRLGYFTRELKQLAKQTRCPVICLTQYRKEGQTEIPTTEDIFGASKIINDADVIELLYSPVAVGEVADTQNYRNEGNPPWNDPEGEPEWFDLVSGLIVKHRGGRTGRANYRFEKNFSRFQDWTTEIKDIKQNIIQKEMTA